MRAAAYLDTQRGASANDTITQYAKLVQRIAYHLAARLPRSVEVDDLIQAGMIGLMEATGSFDPNAGASFETFASIRIRGAMLDELRKGDWAPRSVHRKVREASEAIQQIEQRTGRAAASNEIAAALGVNLEDYHKLLDNAARTQVLSFHNGETDSQEAMQIADDDRDSPERKLGKDEFHKVLAGAIDQLPERERLVMALYYQEQLNLKEIGAVLNVTESRVCQLHGQALVRLRARLSTWIGEGELPA